MNAPLFPVRPSQISAVAGVAKAVADHACVIVAGRMGIGTAASLNQAEYELSDYRVRCIRVHGAPSGGFSLRDLIAQVVDRPDAATLTDHDLKAGFLALTEPGEGCDLVVLLVAEAHSLLPSAMRYIQFACRSSPKLRVVLAGHPNLAATLAPDEFAYLRQVTQTLQMPDLVEPAVSGSAPAMREPPVSRRSGAPALVRLGLAALLVPLVGFIWWRHVPAPPMTEVPVEVSSVDVPAAQPVTAEPPATEQEHADEVFPPDLESEPNPAPALAAADNPPPVTNDARAEEIFPPDIESESSPAPALASTDSPLPVINETPVEAAPVLPVATAEARVPELPAESVDPAESSTAANGEPPATAAPEPAMEAAQKALAPAEAATPLKAAEATPDTVQAPEPAAQEPDIAPSPPKTVEAVSPAVVAPPVPSLPKRSRPAAPPLRAVQHARAETPRIAEAAVASPIRLASQQRCRDIVLRSQLGKDLSDGDKLFLRNDCRAD